MTTTIMTDWLQKHCILDAQWKCKQLGLPFKMLLIMDNAPSHPHYMQDVIRKNCNIVFLPPRTTSLVQPLDQELIATVTQIYHKDMYDFLWSRTDSGKEVRGLQALQEEDSDVDLVETAAAPPAPPAYDKETVDNPDSHAPPTQPTTAQITVSILEKIYS